MFFFEKKNQKTFGYWISPVRPAHSNIQKFFASFFQKRSACFTASMIHVWMAAAGVSASTRAGRHGG
jgi:hypothetical protein